MATEPNCNHVFSFPREGGGTTRFIHDLPLTLKHHYPLPAIGTSEIPLFQGESASTARPIKADWHCALALGHRSGSRENTNSTLRNSSASSRLERRTGWTTEYSVSTSETRYRNLQVKSPLRAATDRELLGLKIRLTQRRWEVQTTWT